MCELFIENGFHKDGELYLGQMDISMGGFYNNTLVLFQYHGMIIGSGIMNILLEKELYRRPIVCFDMDTVKVFKEGITSYEFKSIVVDFKRFNSVAQRIDNKYAEKINNLIIVRTSSHKKILDECSSVVFDKSEGGKINYYTTKYERVNKYRSEAVRIHGLRCEICGFDFGKTYGSMGEGFIEVHHKVPLFSLEQEVIPNPETDMICVCSNCHRMLHRDKYSMVEPEELKKIVEQEKN